MDSERIAVPDLEEKEEALYSLTADAVRNRSQEGNLTFGEEILRILGAQQEQACEGRFEDIMAETMIRNADILSIPGHDGLPCYYSTIHMSEPYARLLVRKEGNPLVMLAETVRENSRMYPRPIRRDTFKDSPFNLTDQEMSVCLQKMIEGGEYGDIAQTTTSEGTIFLYSTLYLEPDHASMLAEWVDVGQHKSP